MRPDRTGPWPRRLLAAALAASALALPAHATARTADDFHANDPRLVDLIERLLADNPGLASADARADAASTRPAVVGSLPNPELAYRWFAETPETRVGPQEHMLEISQGLPWRGKLAREADRAESLAESSHHDADGMALSLVAALKRMWYDLAYLQEALRVNGEERRLLERLEEMALARYGAGGGSRQAVIRVQTDMSRLLDAETDLRTRLDRHLHHIGDLIGSAEHGLGIGPIELELPDPVFERATLEERALTTHPRILAAGRRIGAAAFAADRRALDRRPDFRVGLGYTLVGRRDDPAGIAMPPPDNGQDVLALTVGVSLPVRRDRIHAGVADATEQRRAAEHDLTMVRNGIAHDIQEALLRFDALTRRALLYRDVIIAQAGESLTSAETAYAAGTGSFADLIDAARVVFAARLAERRMVADVWIALTDLELAVGSPVLSGDGRAAALTSPGGLE